MLIYEKAIENYAKKINEYYERERKERIAWYVQNVERMTATGKCFTGISCDDCPVRLAEKLYPKDVKPCYVNSEGEIKQYIAMEYKEAQNDEGAKACGTDVGRDS